MLRELGRSQKALNVLCEAVNAFPLNWSAWKAIAGLCHDREQVCDNWF